VERDSGHRGVGEVSDRRGRMVVGMDRRLRTRIGRLGARRCDDSKDNAGQTRKNVYPTRFPMHESRPAFLVDVDEVIFVGIHQCLPACFDDVSAYADGAEDLF
jgi:hypothetical protein